MWHQRSQPHFAAKMEGVASMLNEVAGGLQQSFGTIFERVGQSLEQSAQMMQMMNSMMETALLQNLVVNYDVRAVTDPSKPPFSLVVEVENRSQIQLEEVTIRVQFLSSAESVERPIEQGLDANSSATATIPLSAVAAGRDGSIQIAVRSPGTHEWLQKEVRIRILLLKMGVVKPTRDALERGDDLVRAFSDKVPVNPLRDAFALSAFDPLLDATVGYYSLHVPAGVVGLSAANFAISVQQSDESVSGVRVIVATDRGSDHELAHQLCRLLLDELESL